MSAQVDLTELEARAAAASEAASAAWRALGRTLDDKRRAISVRLDAARKQIEAEAGAQFDADLHRLLRQSEESVAAAEAAALAVGYAHLAAMGSPNRVEWVRECLRFSSRQGEYKPTGRRGVLEVWTRQSRRPANTGVWSEPKVGEIVVRILEKDGTPSLLIDLRRSIDNWRPKEAAPADAAGPVAA